LDNQITFKNQKYVPKEKITMEETLNLVKDTFTGAGERDIYTGDSVDIRIITKDGIKKEIFELKKD
jgi:20S proteasome subunit beta 6